MRHKNKQIKKDLDLKILRAADRKIRKYHPLSPKEYLEFIDTTIKLLPDSKKAMELSMRNYPKVPFYL